MNNDGNSHPLPVFVVQALQKLSAFSSVTVPCDRRRSLLVEANKRVLKKQQVLLTLVGVLR